MLSLISSLLLLGSAAAERKIIFGRSVHKRPSPLKRIRSSPRVTETSPISKEVTTVDAPRVLLFQDGFRAENMPNDTLSMPLSFEFSMFGGIPHLEGSSVSLSPDFSILIIETLMNPTISPSAWTDADAMSTEQSGTINSTSSEDMSSLTTQDEKKHLTAIVAAGCSFAIAMLIAAFYRRSNRDKEAAQDVIGQKYIDGSDDGESTSTANHTADLTCAAGCDRTSPSSRYFVLQDSILSLELGTLSEEQSAENCECGSLVYSITSGENGD